jgi:hypothetical protein
VGLPIPKKRICPEERLVGTLFKTFRNEFGEFVGNFAIFYSFKISNGSKKISIYFFMRVSHREVRYDDFLKPFFLKHHTQKSK